jgi:hypothetical protein
MGPQSCEHCFHLGARRGGSGGVRLWGDDTSLPPLHGRAGVIPGPRAIEKE